MTVFEKLQYAKARLSLARMMGDASEVEKWREHVAYWESRPTTGAGDLASPHENQGVFDNPPSA